MKPITRKEIFENAIARGEKAPIKPMTRKEILMAKEAEREASGGGGEYFETVGGDTLTWDGNIDGLQSAGEMFFCVSDVVPTIEELSLGGKVTIEGMGEMPFTAEMFQDMGDIVLFGDTAMIIIVKTDNAVISVDEDMTLTFPVKGIYSAREESEEMVMYVSSFTINGYTGFESTRLKYEYLPVCNWEISEEELVAESTEKNYDVAYDTFVNGGTVIIATSFNSNPIYCRVLTAMVVDGAVMFLYADPTTAKVRLIGSFNGKFNQTT